MKKIILIFWIFSFTVSSIAQVTTPGLEASKIDFNRNWVFMKSQVEWPVDLSWDEAIMDQVILPHTWNANDMGPGLTDPYIGGGWYRKRFTAPTLDKEQRLLIEFEGVNNFHKVWVNGGYAGGRNGGFLSSLHDITDLLKEGENEILVRADNSYKPEAGMPEWIGWNRYGGITQPVWLHIQEHAYIALAGVEIRTPDVNWETAVTNVSIRIQETLRKGSDLSIQYTLLDPGGMNVSTTNVDVTTKYAAENKVSTQLPVIENPQLWSDESPVLYTLITEIFEGKNLIDRHSDRIGYRYFHFSPDSGFFLNGKPTKLRGANIHIFFPGLGNALPERFGREDMELMKKMGCNFMRTSHYPRPDYMLDLCDELGILVMEEQPYWHGSVRPTGGEQAIVTASRLVHDMISQHGNHPSIIAWNTVNEIMIAPPYRPGVGFLPEDYPDRNKWRINPEDYPYLLRHVKSMVETFHSADPDRPVSLVVGGQWHKNDIAGLTAAADIVAYNGGAMNFSEDPYVDAVTGKSYAFRPDYFREKFPERVHIMSEGILNDYTYARGDWGSEQKGWHISAKYWNTINQRPWFSGGSMWCFTDYTYLSPMVVDRFTDNSGLSHYDRHGVVDRFRLPKDLFYFYEAMWADHPVIHILGHWNHAKGSVRDVVVFTNCSDIKLTLNGKSLGKGVSAKEEFPYINNAPIVWENVIFEEGILTVQGKFKGELFTDKRVTEGKPANIKISGTNDIIANGRDISYIDFEIADEDGNRCYTVTDTLTVKVSGAAMPLHSDKIPVDAGLARIAIRSNGETGDIMIRATGSGLNEGVFRLKAIPEKKRNL